MSAEQRKDPSSDHPGFDGARTIRESPPGEIFKPPATDPEEADTDLDARGQGLDAFDDDSVDITLEDEEAPTPLYRSDQGRDDQDRSDPYRSDQLGDRAAGEVTPRGEQPTRRVSPREAADHLERARQISSSVELSGEEAAAAYQLALEQGPEEPSVTTAEVNPGDLQRINAECRMCGVMVARPVPHRFTAGEDAGFRCHRCRNIFCGDHVVRISGFFETLLSGARYSCQLCVPDNAPPDPHAETSDDA